MRALQAAAAMAVVAVVVSAAACGTAAQQPDEPPATGWEPVSTWLRSHPAVVDSGWRRGVIVTASPRETYGCLGGACHRSRWRVVTPEATVVAVSANTDTDELAAGDEITWRTVLAPDPLTSSDVRVLRYAAVAVS